MRNSFPVIASAAKQSMSPREDRMDCFVAEFIIGPAEGGTRWLLAMTEATIATLVQAS
jgi:hypothetical protein